MKNLRPKELSALGLKLLEEAVIQVLLDARENGEHVVGATEIARRAGIPVEQKGPVFSGAIGTGILCRLLEQGYVEQLKEGKCGWKLCDTPQ
ncbi:MAG: hypothetical protein OXG03_03230 [Gammaproteobacteria bacterium]|nr:hypothetical protein [Gammaproteobacteria bacterium]